MAERPAESDAHDEPEARDERIERTVDRVIGRRGLRPRYAAYLVMVIWLIAVLAFGALQRIVDPHTYPTIWPALWWAVQTVTTVGYGDNVPQQAAGKVVASVLMIGGLAFLSIVTATITSSFVGRRQERARARGEDPVMQQLVVLSEQVQGLEAELRRARGSDDEVPKSA
jgi:voltage-gated potassium channel Kch